MRSSLRQFCSTLASASTRACGPMATDAPVPRSVVAGVALVALVALVACRVRRSDLRRARDEEPGPQLGRTRSGRRGMRAGAWGRGQAARRVIRLRRHRQARRALQYAAAP
jgi:hypothetical protein